MLPCSLRTNLIVPMIDILFLSLPAGCSDILPPARPQNLTATAVSQQNIQVNWTCEDEEIYDFWTGEYTPYVSCFVYRDVQRAGDVGDPEYHDHNLDPDTLYC